MPMFRKKPVEIEAVQWNGVAMSLPLPQWLVEALKKDPLDPGAVIRMGDQVHIQTLEGVMKASPNDWIIRGVKGEIYPCKPDIFEATYDAA